MNEELQRHKQDEFHYIYTKTVSRKDFGKEMEEIYNNHYKLDYEQDGFRRGEVPFNMAILNPKVASSILKTVAIVDRQIFVEEIIKDFSEIGSIYDIKDGEDQTDFAAMDLSLNDPVVFQLNVELASYIDSVDYENVSVDESVIKTKPVTDKDLVELFKEYKKVKKQQNKVTKTSYVAVVLDDGKDTEELVFNLGEKFPEGTEELKIQSHAEIKDLVMDKKIGYEFKYALTGRDGTKLDVSVTIKDIYRIMTLSNDDFVEMLKEQGNIPADQKEDLDITKVKKMFREHLESIRNEEYTEEVRGLTFAALRDATGDVHYNENEIKNLVNQFSVQVQKMAEQEGMKAEEYITKNFGNQKLMEDYADASQRARVLQAAIYRKIGKDNGWMPTYMQLEAFVKTFVFKLDPTSDMDEAMVQQVSQQVHQVLEQPLNRQRLIESWYAVKAEDLITKQVGLL